MERALRAAVTRPRRSRGFGVLLLAALAGCAAVEPSGPRQAWAVGVGGTERCEVVDRAAAWRAASAGFGALACDFAVARVVLGVVPADHAVGPLQIAWLEEEGVDVLVLTPTRGAADPGRSLRFAVVVPANRAQLAVVYRAPTADGAFVERTLRVFDGR